MWWCDTSSFWNAYESIKSTVNKWNKVDIWNVFENLWGDFNKTNDWKEKRAWCTVDVWKVALEELIAWKKVDAIVWLLKKLPWAKSIMKDNLSEEWIREVLEKLTEHIESSYLTIDDIREIVWLGTKFDLWTLKDELFIAQK